MIRRLAKNNIKLLSSSLNRDTKNVVVVVPIVTRGLRTKKSDDNKITATPPPPAAANPENAWEEVRVPEGVYYWNTVTDETTAIGAPRPTGPTAALSNQQSPQSPSLMSTMAEGAAWGVGMSVARNMVGSMFGVSLPGGDDDDETHSV